MQAELVLNAQAELGEGVHWDPETGRIHWVNIEGRQLRIFDPATGAENMYSFGQRISAAVPAADGGWVVALQDGIYKFREPQTLELLALVESDIPGNRLNDAKCDSKGRLWFGSMSMEGEQHAGSLYVMEREGEVRKVLSRISTSNGLAWDDRRGLMYYIDTSTRGVDVMDYDPGSGTVSGIRTVVRFPEGAGEPDGMTIDREGMIWVAHWNGGCVSRWNPHTGEQLASVEVPAPLVTSCTFGGEQLDELYITTARAGMSQEELQRWPLAGGLFRVNAGVKGVQANRFAG